MRERKSLFLHSVILFYFPIPLHSFCPTSVFPLRRSPTMTPKRTTTGTVLDPHQTCCSTLICYVADPSSPATNQRTSASVNTCRAIPHSVLGNVPPSSMHRSVFSSSSFLASEEATSSRNERVCASRSRESIISSITRFLFTLES